MGFSVTFLYMHKMYFDHTLPALPPPLFLVFKLPYMTNVLQ